MNLTKEQILELPAGPEMDTLIAKVIKGWQAGTMKDWHEKMGMGPGRNPDFEIYLCGPDGGWMPRDQYKPSTTLASAWSAFAGRGWFLHEGGHAGVRESVVFESARHIQDWMPLASGDTAPLAICRAALLAILHEQLTERQNQLKTKIVVPGRFVSTPESQSPTP